jgi:carbon storage regulator
MLILTRRPGERVVIGDEILVTVMGVSGHTVRLGIAAPAGVPIYREEIWLAVSGGRCRRAPCEDPPGRCRGGRRRGADASRVAAHGDMAGALVPDVVPAPRQPCAG